MTTRPTVEPAGVGAPARFKYYIGLNDAAAWKCTSGPVDVVLAFEYDKLRQQLAELLRDGGTLLVKYRQDIADLEQQLAEMRAKVWSYLHVDRAFHEHGGTRDERYWALNDIRKMAREDLDTALAPASQPSRGKCETGEKMFAFDIELRGEQARVEGWFSGSGPDDPCSFDIDAIWIGWSEASRGLPEHAGGPNPLDLSTLTDDEDEAIMDAAFSAVASRWVTEPVADCAQPERQGAVENDDRKLIVDALMMKHIHHADHAGKYGAQDGFQGHAPLAERCKALADSIMDGASVPSPPPTDDIVAFLRDLNRYIYRDQNQMLDRAIAALGEKGAK